MPRRSTRANPAGAPGAHDPARPTPGSRTPGHAASPTTSARRGPGPQKPSIYTISQKRLDSLLHRAEKERLAHDTATGHDEAAGRSRASRRPAGSRHLDKADRALARIEGQHTADRLREMNFQAHWDMGSGSGETAGLPDNDLLRAIHHHASEFYHEQGLMHPKIKRSNERGWYVLRKRRMLSEQGGLADPVPDEEELPPSFDLRQNARNAARKRLSAVVLPATKGGARGVKRKAGAQRPSASPNTSPRKEVEVVIPLPRGWSRVPRGSTAGPVEEAGPSSRMLRARNTRRASTDESDLDTDGESEYRGGETDHEDDSESARDVGQDEDDEVDSIAPEQEDDGVDMKRKYRSKQREMHRALDGSALLAIGILVEEHILAQLHQAGYVSEHEEEEPVDNRVGSTRRGADGLSDEDD